MTDFWNWFTTYPIGIGLAPWEWVVVAVVTITPLVIMIKWPGR